MRRIAAGRAPSASLASRPPATIAARNATAAKTRTRAAARRGLQRSAGEKRLKRFQRLRVTNPAAVSVPGRR